eukprot:1496696-Pyramimonas_sp.AAC.1
MSKKTLLRYADFLVGTRQVQTKVKPIVAKAPEFRFSWGQGGFQMFRASGFNGVLRSGCLEARGGAARAVVAPVWRHRGVDSRCTQNGAKHVEA